MVDRFLLIVLSALAVWRMGYYITNEDGPFDMMDRIRAFVGVKYATTGQPYGLNIFSKLISCFYCVSIWLSFGVWLIVGGYSDALDIISMLSVSTVAIMIKELIHG